MFGYRYKQAQKSGNIGCAVSIITFVLFILTFIFGKSLLQPIIIPIFCQGKYLIQPFDISIIWRTTIRIVFFTAAVYGFAMVAAAAEDQDRLIRGFTKH
jgi:hypothetical protein